MLSVAPGVISSASRASAVAGLRGQGPQGSTHQNSRGNVGVALSVHAASLVQTHDATMQVIKQRICRLERQTLELRDVAASTVKMAGMEAGLALKADQYAVDQRFLRFAKDIEQKLEAKAERGYVEGHLASKSSLADTRALIERVNKFHDLLELKGRDLFVGYAETLRKELVRKADREVVQEALSKLASRSDLSTAKKRIDALEASVSAYGNEREEIIHNMEEKLTQNYEGELGKLKLRANGLDSIVTALRREIAELRCIVNEDTAALKSTVESVKVEVQHQNMVIKEKVEVHHKESVMKEMTTKILKEIVEDKHSGFGKALFMHEIEGMQEELLDHINEIQIKLTKRVDVDGLKARISFNENENAILRERLKQARAESSESRARIERLEAELGLKPITGVVEKMRSSSRGSLKSRPKTPCDARVEHETSTSGRLQSKWTKAASKVTTHIRQNVHKTAIEELRDLVWAMGQKIAAATSRVNEIGKKVDQRVEGLSSETYSLARELARHEQNYRLFTKRNKEIFSRLVDNQIKVHRAGGGAGGAVGPLTVMVAPTPCRPSPRPQTAGPVARRATLARRPQSARHRNQNARRPQSARVSIHTTLFEDMLALQKELQNTPGTIRTTTGPGAATSSPTARSVSRKRRPQSAR